MIKTSIEYRRGNLHRHHHFDYHAVIMHHAEEYHNCIKEIVYENIDLVHVNTKIGKLACLMYKAISDLHLYHIINHITRKDVFMLHNTETNGNYIVEIAKTYYRCNCPDFIHRERQKHMPCKHIIIVACVKGYEINI